MTVSRRDLLIRGAATAALLTVPRPLLAHFGPRAEPLPPITDPRVRDLAFRGVQAARAAGATYCDARLTHQKQRVVAPARGRGDVSESEDMSVGVRALVDGYWGFASSSVWSPDEMARLGAEAVYQAKTNALGKPRQTALADIPVIADGHWEMPVERDAFTVDVDEIIDLLYSLELYVERTNELRRVDDFLEAVCIAALRQQEKAFASSAGSYCTQRVHLTEGQFIVQHTKTGYKLPLDMLSPAGLGWELFTGQPLRQEFDRVMAEVLEDLALPVKAIEVGRFESAFDALSTARLLDATLGRATELDRALGFEANAGGTSFIDDPLSAAGTLRVAAPMVTVSANRSARGAAATVSWDDEGVTSDDFTLVDRGRVVDFQTTRESASWLADYYRASGRTPRSHACAAAPTGIEAPLTRAPNLALHPGAGDAGFDELVGRLERGVAVKSLVPEMDFQNLNGLGFGRVYEVRKGKRVARYPAAGLLFRAPDLWKACVALGGQGSVRRFGMETQKGQPPQSTYHSVSAPAALFTQVTLIDPHRKA